MKSVERVIETLLYQSRWLLAPIYLGLAVLMGFMMAVIERHLTIHKPKAGEA